MTDEKLQAELNALVRLANKLDAEAKCRYGEEGFLFFEAEGSFHIMSGDSDEGCLDRQAHIKFSSDDYCTMGAGAW